MTTKQKSTDKKGKLFIFSAPSGSGKTTIVKHLLQQNLGLEFSISATSRAPRGKEIDGKDYHFLTTEAFKNKIDANEFLEWEEVYTNNFYGTLKSEVERIRNKGKHVVFDVDVVGGVNIKKFYGNEALSIFVQPPSIEALKERLENRSTETPEKIKMRIAKAQQEMQLSNQFDVILINDNLETALQEATKLVTEFINNKKLSK